MCISLVAMRRSISFAMQDVKLVGRKEDISDACFRRGIIVALRLTWGQTLPFHERLKMASSVLAARTNAVVISSGPAVPVGRIRLIPLQLCFSEALWAFVDHGGCIQEFFGLSVGVFPLWWRPVTLFSIMLLAVAVEQLRVYQEGLVRLRRRRIINHQWCGTLTIACMDRNWIQFLGEMSSSCLSSAIACWTSVQASSHSFLWVGWFRVLTRVLIFAER